MVTQAGVFTASSWRSLLPSLPIARARSSTIVDELIEERAPVISSNSVGRHILRHLLYPLLGYREATRLAGEVENLAGHEIFTHVARELDIRAVIQGLENLPRNGRAILVCTHPTGLADGLAVHSALMGARPDLWFLANADAHRLAPGMRDLVVPVEWELHKRTHAKTKHMLAETRRIMENEELLVIFPSGRLSYIGWRGLSERPWQPTVITLARRFQAPIIPVRIIARNSLLFYAFSMLSKELRDITLFVEMLNKAGRPFEIHLGSPISPNSIEGDPTIAVSRLQRFVETRMRRPELLHKRSNATERLALLPAE